MFKILLFTVLCFFTLIYCSPCCIDCPIESWSTCPSTATPISSPFVCYDNLAFRICGVSESQSKGNGTPVCISKTGASDCSNCMTSANPQCSNFFNDTVDCYCNMSLLITENFIHDCYGNDYNSSSICYRNYSNNIQLQNANVDLSSRSLRKRQSRKVIIEPMQRTLLSLNSSQSVIINLEDSSLIIYFLGLNKPVALVTKDANSFLTALNQTPAIVILPQTYFIRNGDVQITILDGDNIVYQNSIPIIAKVICRLDDCVFCLNAYHNFRCLPKSQQVLFIFVLTLLVLLILYMMSCVFSVLFGLLRVVSCCCVAPFSFARAMAQSRISKNTASYIKNKYYNIPQNVSDTEKQSSEVPVYIDNKNEDIENLNTNTTQYDDMIRKNKAVKKVYYERNKKGQFIEVNVFTILAILFLVCSALGCDDGLTQPININHCVQGKDITTCNVELQITTTLTTIGATNCITLSNQITGEPVYNVEVTYVANTAGYTLRNLYYTSGWSGEFIYDHRCFLAGQCSGDVCQTLNGTSNPTANGELTDGSLAGNTVVQWPGLTVCNSGCSSFFSGNALCECLLPVESCIFSRYAIVPNSAACLILEPNQLIFQPTISVFISDNSGAVVVNATVFPSNGEYTNVNGDFEINYVGQFLSTIPQLSNRKIAACTICNPNCVTQSYLVDASDPNAPVAQSIGDIQSSTLSGLTTPSTNGFLFAGDLSTLSITGESATYTFVNPGIEKLANYATFPVLVGGDLWTYQQTLGAQLVSNLINPGAAVINIKTSHNLSVAQLTNVVCPKANYITASGCYSCDLGFTIEIQAKSVCKEGLVVCDVEDPAVTLYTQSISLSADYKTFMIRGQTNTPTNAFTLILSAGEYSSSLEVSFIASQSSNLGNTTTTTGHGTKGTNSFVANPFTALENLFKGIGKWYDDLWGLFILLIFIALFIVLIYFFALPIILSTFKYATKKIIKDKTEKQPLKSS